jgi:periplasmic divalent cation tolerance protein
MRQTIIILNTCPDREWADKIAHHLVEARLAGCVNIVPQLTSVYRWQGQTEMAEEHQLIIKAAQENYQAVESAIKSLHPYQVPEIIALPIVNGSADYLDWIHSCHNDN